MKCFGFLPMLECTMIAADYHKLVWALREICTNGIDQKNKVCFYQCFALLIIVTNVLKILGFFRLVPLQFLNFREVLLLFTYSEFYHYNSSSIWNISRYTSGIRMEKHWAQLQRTQHYHIFVWTKLPLPPLLSLRHWRMDLTSHHLPSFVYSPWHLPQLPWQRSGRWPLACQSAMTGRSSYATMVGWSSWTPLALAVGRENPRASWASKLMGKDFRTLYRLFR